MLLTQMKNNLANLENVCGRKLL